MEINRNIRSSKEAVLDYFRNRSTEFLAEVNEEFGNTQYKQKAIKLNKLIVKTKNNLIEIVEQKAKKDNWTNEELLEGVLMVTYL